MATALSTRKLPNTLGAFDAKTRLPELLRAVRKGQRFTITHRGQPVAVLGPPTLESQHATDAKGWPLGFFEDTFGSCPGLKRPAQPPVQVRE